MKKTKFSDSQEVGECIPNTVAVCRAYNAAFAPNGAKNTWDSNHRYSTTKTDIDEMVSKHGWRDEGVAYCVPG